MSLGTDEFNTKNNVSSEKWKTIAVGGGIFLAVVIAVLVLSDECTSAKFFGGEITTKCQPENPPEPKIDGNESFTVGTPAFFSAGDSRDDGEIKKYHWDFGDGTPTNEGISVNHIYKNEGKYTVTLTVTDDSELSRSTSYQIEIVSEDIKIPIPIISITPEGPYKPNQQITFDGSKSYDPDGTITKYNWDFGDENEEDGSQVTHMYKNSGQFSITLQVVDDSGYTDKIERIITIETKLKENGGDKVPPIAEMSCSPKDIQEGQTVSCNATNSYDPDGTISMYEWDFGDGTIKSGKITNHTYRSDGPYTIQLTVIDNDGLRSDSRSSVTVIPTPIAHPIAEMSCSPKDIQEGQTVYNVTQLTHMILMEQSACMSGTLVMVPRKVVK